MMSQNPEIFATPTNQSAQHIYFMEFLLASFFTFAFDNAPYIVQYDQESSL